MPGGRLSGDPSTAVQDALTARYGEGKWVLSTMEYGVYLDWTVVDEKKLNRREVMEAAAAAVRALPHIFRAYSADALSHGEVPHDFLGDRVTNGFFPQRSGDVFYLPDPYWIAGKTGTTHGTIFGYDTHVPVIFMGPGIKSGVYNEAVRPNDIAPTLATLLSVETPSGSVGRALAEILK
jgi:hypothetical protein